MAQAPKGHVFAILLLVLFAIAEATPPGIAKNPSHATCKIKKYKHCYNLVHVCPKFCPDSCTVECASCKPICGPSSPSPSEDNPTPPESPPSPSPPEDNPTPPESSPSPSSEDNPTPPESSPSPSPSEDNPTPPESPPSPSPPSPSVPSPTTPTVTASPPSPPSQTPPTVTPSPPSPPSESPPNPTPPTNTPTPPSPSTPSSSPPSSASPTPSPPPSKAKCKNKNYPQCYNVEYTCPKSCPGGCEVDCVTCKPVCKCDKPGAVCQDPRFIGGDGITFYFHGKKDRDFCLVSDSNIHINAHFIGRRNENMGRDFTWVQSIAILFDQHQLFLGALKTSIWDDSVDRLSLTFDGEPITLPETDGAEFRPESTTGISVTRAGDTNNVVIEVEGNFKITAKVVPITEEDSRIHNYGITQEDCFAHLDLGFKFYSLSDKVNGVLGQTYKPGHMSRVNIGAKMPVMGGDRKFETSSLFATDCTVARFSGSHNDDYYKNLELPGLSCESGIDGQGVVCKR